MVEPPTSGRVVFLNGPPSVGKSATAAALQELLPTPHYYFSLDDYLCGYRDSHWLADDGTLFARMVEPYLRNIVTLLSFGHDVIAEAMVLPASQGLYLRLFAGQRVTFVGVRCSLEVATRRELQRGNRRKGPINLDVPEFTLVHAHGAYDLEVDTSESAPADVAAQIMPVIDDPPHPSAFDRLRRTESAVGSSPLILSHDGRHRQVRVRAREDEEPAPDQRHDADRHVDQ